MKKQIQSGNVRQRWDERAEGYDDWYKTFEGAVENYVDWELLKVYLPKNTDAHILDAAGGTGRITLSLAKMGFHVTLCDISSGMLGRARQKLMKEEIIDKVDIVECDVNELCFADERFDFVLCWDDGAECAKELVRVAKRGGKISLFLVNKCSAAISTFYGHPDFALDLISSKSHYVSHDNEKHRVIETIEARERLEAEGVRIFDMFAVCGWLNVLRIPEEIRDSHTWDERYFNKVTEMVLRLSKEPAVMGMSRHLVLYGEKK